MAALRREGVTFDGVPSDSWIWEIRPTHATIRFKMLVDGEKYMLGDFELNKEELAANLAELHQRMRELGVKTLREIQRFGKRTRIVNVIEYK